MFLAALMVGIILVKLERLGAAVLAGWGGFVLGILINESWLYIYASPNLTVSIIAALTILCFTLGYIW
jgi:hypothetical protein